MKKLFFYIIFCYLLVSCQSSDIIKNVEFDYSEFKKLTFLSNSIEIKNEYKISLEDSFVDHTMETSPSERLINWVKNNIIGFGVENKLIIEIKDASIIETNVESAEKIAGIIKKSQELKFELSYFAIFSLYDDSDNLLAFTEIQSKRTVTSNTLISLYEKEKILEQLVYKGLEDFTLKADQMSREYLGEFIL
ncbi:MAG: hypothetical protein CMI98_00865 [Pelagibacteraceae bacterium]|nr:hypothetical protein [Pelagibacteraceae bacterium]